MTKTLWETGSIVFALSGVLWTFCYSRFDLPSLFKSYVIEVIRAFLQNLRINNNQSPYEIFPLAQWHGASSGDHCA